MKKLIKKAAFCLLVAAGLAFYVAEPYIRHLLGVSTKEEHEEQMLYLRVGVPLEIVEKAIGPKSSPEGRQAFGESLAERIFLR